MKRTNLESPALRPSELPYREFHYPRRAANYLSVPSPLSRATLFDVLESRQTCRSFEGPLDEPALSTILWYSSKTRTTRREASGFVWQHRPSPSGGGRHPLDLLVWQSDTVGPCLYDPIAHSLVELNANTPSAGEELIAHTRHIVPFKTASLIWFAAQFDRTLSRYQHGESVVWRDAGVLTAAICLIAEALGLSCCPLGITGEPFISRLLGSKSLVVGAGGLLIGRRF